MDQALITAAQQWGRSQGYTQTGRVVVDRDGNGVAMGWPMFALLHRAEAQEWLTARPRQERTPRASRATGATGTSATKRYKERTPEDMGVGIGDTIRRVYEGTEYVATILPGGEIEVAGLGRFPTPMASAKGICGPKRGGTGWGFWFGYTRVREDAPPAQEAVGAAVKDALPPAPEPEQAAPRKARPVRFFQYDCDTDGPFQAEHYRKLGAMPRCPRCDERATFRGTVQDQAA